MIKTILVDDVENARAALRKDLSIYCEKVQIVAEAGGVKEAFDLIEKLRPDLVFLDISMSDGTGFDLLELLKKEKKSLPAIIFTTAHDEFALKAFRFSAVDYLLKPVDPDELVAAVKKVNVQHQSDPMNLLLDRIRAVEGAQKRIALNSLEKVHIVNISDIIQCESNSNYTVIYLSGKKQVMVTRTLKDFEELLKGDDFLRVHNSHLINMKHIKEFV